MSWWQVAAWLVLTLVMLAALDVTARALRDDAVSFEDRLPVALSPDRVYLLGNSMFKTGIDVPALAAELPDGVGVDFAYYNGSYTNLWYLIAKNALAPSKVRPPLLVWGFRPTYAMLPDFRQRAEGEIERFERFESEGDPRTQAAAPNDSGDGAASVHRQLARVSLLYGDRDALRDRMSDGLRAIGLFAWRRVSTTPSGAFARLMRDRNLSVADEILRAASSGTVQSAAENVVDDGDRFIRGAPVLFAESLVPRIAETLEDAGFHQVVLVFKPVDYTTGAADDESRRFAAEAVAYLEAKGIPFLSLVDEPRLQRRHYAKGDHYNAEGRALVTRLVAEKLNEELRRRSARASSPSSR